MRQRSQERYEVVQTVRDRYHMKVALAKEDKREDQSNSSRSHDPDCPLIDMSQGEKCRARRNGAELKRGRATS